MVWYGHLYQWRRLSVHHDSLSLLPSDSGADAKGQLPRMYYDNGLSHLFLLFFKTWEPATLLQPAPQLLGSSDSLVSASSFAPVTVGSHARLE